MNHKRSSILGKTLFILGSFLFLSACGFKNQKFNQIVADKLDDKVECSDFEPFFWHTLHDAALNSENPTSWGDLKAAVKQTQKNPDMILKQIEALEKTLKDDFWEKTMAEQTEIWAKLELQVEDEKGWPEMQSALRNNFSSLRARGLASCAAPETPKPPAQAAQSPSELGGRWVMSAAYQSCEAARIPAMTALTPDAQGILDHGAGSNAQNGGRLRTIQNLAALQATHPYLRIQNKEAGCFDVEAKPLIYDFGGKPGYVSSSDKEIDFFKNNGSGGRELGVDCSGLVLASLGVQGLRLIPNQNLTAGVTAGFGTASLINLNAGKWSCLDFITLGSESVLKAGDVMTIVGHTILIDEVGTDPFGIGHTKSQSDCAKLTEDDFDFTVLQSAPSKNGVGINRFVARDYLKTSTGMKSGFIKYAKAHCQAVWSKKPSKPKWSDVSIVRHKGTAECRGEPLVVKNESCLRSCSSLIRP